jgi:predicted HTH transcriptional regulator
LEDRHHEFKNYRDIINNDITQTVLKYIAAFLNSGGGVLYVGVDDSSVVWGFELPQHDFDRFLTKLDGESKINMLPPLLPHRYSIRRIPVQQRRRGKELWVLEVKVPSPEKDRRQKVLTVYNREVYMRLNASTHRLDAVNLIEYIRHHDEEHREQRTPLDLVE